MYIRKGAHRLAIGLLLLLSCHEGATTATPPPTPVVRPPRRALLIGIDNYSASGIQRRSGLRPADSRGWPPLRGAVRDVNLLREMLILRYGFEPGAIVTLKNQQATRDAIVQAIEEHLIAPAAKGDVVFFYYAGHGSQVENSLSSELDKLDESIVPADSKLGAPDIRDKDLAVLFNRILDHDARLTVIFDSCHSGSVTRGFPGDSEVRSVTPDTRDVRDATEPPAPESRGALVLSASKDFGRSFEAVADDGRYHGVFSWALLRAMREGVRHEAAVDTFLRVQAMMRADTPYQDPVIGGSTTVQATPLLSGGGVAPSKVTVAVEQVMPDGTVVLQGGWAHGLTKGSVLRPRGGDASAPEIRITAMLGLGRSEGRLVASGRRASPKILPSGTLLDVVTWAATPGRPLRVWMARSSRPEEALVFARQVRDAARASRIRWIEDPTVETPTHTVRWRGGGWEVVIPGQANQRITSSSFVRQLPPKASLFVQLPASPAIAREMRIGPGTDCDSVEPQREPRGADYILVGRLAGSSVEYAWVRPELLEEDALSTPLPARTDWQPSGPAADTADLLRRSVLRLHMIHAWLHLKSPRDAASPYRLALIDPESNAEVRDTLQGGTRYAMHLRPVASPPTRIEQRYYYVFGIDSFGKSILLFPLRGSVENRFPIESERERPARDIDVGGVISRPPYGRDTYFLISSDEPLPNPRILESSGVRTRGPRGGTALEELLSRTGGTSRSPDPLGLSPIWSIDYLRMRSVPSAEEAAAQ
jgi:Caspase domain